MGTSRSNSVGSSPRWKKPRGGLRQMAALLDGYARPIPIETRAGPADARPGDPKPPPPVGGVESGHAVKAGASGGGIGGGGGRPGAGGKGGGITGGAVRKLGKQLIEAHLADTRFLPLLADCAITVALGELLALSTAATLRYRTLSEAPQLFKAYDVSMEKNVGLGLSMALDHRFRKHLVERCGQITDNADKARRAMQATLIEMLADDGQPDTVLKMSAKEIYNALRKTNAMEIVRQFYRNYLFNVIEFLVSSSHAGIAPAAERVVLQQMRNTYCDEFAERIIKRARSKGWRPGEVPEKVAEWQDILIEEEEVYV